MKRQYGVQVIWKDPVQAGANPDTEPHWLAFDTLEQAETHALSYQAKMGDLAERMPWLRTHPGFDPEEIWTARNVAEVRRGERWAVEDYAEWEVYPGANTTKTAGGPP